MREIIEDLYSVLLSRGWTSAQVWVAIAWLVAAFCIGRVVKVARGGVNDLRDYYRKTIQELQQRVNILRSERDDAEQRCREAEQRLEKVRETLHDIRLKYEEKDS